MAQQHRKKRIRLKPRFYLFVLIVCVGIWFFGHWVAGAVDKALLKTVVAQEGEIKQVSAMETVLVRNEILVAAPESGVLKALCQEGEKVRKDLPIFQIVNQEVARERELKLKANADARAKLDQAWTTAQRKFQKETLELDQAAKERIQAISSSDKNSDDVNKLESELSDLLARSQAVEKQSLKAEVEYRKNIKALNQEKNSIEANYAASVQTLKTPQPGVVSYKINASEAPWDNAYLQSLTPQVIRDFKEGVSQNKDGIIQAGQPAAKIIDNDTIKFVGILPKNELGNLTNDKIVTIEFPKYGGQEIKALFLGYGKGDGNLQVVLFQSKDWLPQFASNCKTDARIVYDRYRGIIIPRSCIVEKAGKHGVYVLKKEQPVFVPVQVIGQNRTMAAVSGLNTGLEVVTNPGRIKDSNY